MSKTTKQKIVTFIVMLLIGAAIGFVIHFTFDLLSEGVSTGSSKYYTLRVLPRLLKLLAMLITLWIYDKRVPDSEKQTAKDRIKAIFFPCAFPFILGSLASRSLYVILVTLPALDSLYDKLPGMGL
ncbi:MAG: hypothetical protein E7312_08920 [Clostridiales bacterium]|nr:hypothetical protein [Clostridiales bacterium]